MSTSRLIKFSKFSEKKNDDKKLFRKFCGHFIFFEKKTKKNVCRLVDSYFFQIFQIFKNFRIKKKKMSTHKNFKIFKISKQKKKKKHS